MEIQLSEGKPARATATEVAGGQAQALTSEQVQAIFARLPALPSPTAAATEFKPPAELLPPPRPAITIQESFPPAQAAPTPLIDISEPLKVVRYAPEGEVNTVPFVSITFNQPMVPLGTLEHLAAQDVPARIEPELKGTWRWLGSKTLTFEFASEQIDRLPKATIYRVTVPAGVKSQLGKALAEDFVFSFSTPPPTVVSTFPGDEAQPRHVLFFVAFDQRIEAAKVLEKIQVMAENQALELRLASEQEIEANSLIKQMAKRTLDGRWIAFKTIKPLPPDTRVDVTIAPGVPSAEGPLLSTQAYSYSFSTYAPLRVEESHCGWYDTCPPLSPFNIEFNNPLDPSAFEESLISISPAIPRLNANVSGSSLVISGETRGNTTYEVTLSAKLRDIFGQTLGEEVTLHFMVDRADPILAGPGGNFLTLDPAANGVLTVYALNYSRLDLAIYAVQPENWRTFLHYLENRYDAQNSAQPPGKLLVEKSLKLDIPPETLSAVPIDLKPYTQNGFGQFVVVVSPSKPLIESPDARWQRQSQTVVLWVQLSEIVIDAYSDPTQLIVFVSDLRSGAPLADVSVQAENGAALSSDAAGIVRWPLKDSVSYLTARKGNDLAILPRSLSVWGEDAWRPKPLDDTLAWFVFDDRQMYRPGEEVHIKGWLRRISAGPQGDVGLIDRPLPPLSYQITDASGNHIGSGVASINAWGGFDFAFTIPQQVNLGSAQLTLTAQSGLAGDTHIHAFQIQEFRRPEFEVIARTESQPPFFFKGQATVSVEAKYYAGGGLANADVTWQVTSSPGSYRPPGWDDFTFGNWRPWWYESPSKDEGRVETFQGKTDPGGFHYLNLDFGAVNSALTDPQPQQVVIQATVMDVNRQAWSSAASLLVHPAELYVGLRTQRYFVPKGTPLKVQFIVTDLEGKPVSGQAVEIQASRMEWKTRQGRWVQEETDTQTCQVTSSEEPRECTFQTPLGGTYRITARVRDRLERLNQTTLTRWVSGGETRPALKIEQESVTLIPDKESYQPGETAEILVQAPFAPAEGLLTVSREGILISQRFQVDESGSAILRIPIEESHIPNLNVQVDLVGATPRSDAAGVPQPDQPPRPAYAVGSLTLNIPPLTRTLLVSVTPEQSQLEPGAETYVAIFVKDASGQPLANAEVAVVVVDEAILSLTQYQLGNPLVAFYPKRYSAMESRYGRASLILADPLALAREASEKSIPMVFEALPPMATMMPRSPSMAADEAAEAAAPIPLRLDFNPLAVFAPTAQTDRAGKAQVAFKLPDNLTRYRIMAVVVDAGGRRFGKGEANLTARLPLMVRPSAPRFLNFGDVFELPVVVQNQTDQALDVQVVARANNLEILQKGWRVQVPPNDRLEVRFPAQTMLAGTAQVQVAAVSAGYADAAQFELPVYTPATSEAFATYGVIDEGSIAQPIQYPSGVIPQYGGLEISTSSTALQALTDAVLYLVSYPFECSEQIASRVIAIAALRDVLTAFKASGMPAPAELEKRVQSDLERLQGMQNADGGFPLWVRGQNSLPFHSIHVTHALVRAREKRYSVPEGMLDAALSHLKSIENTYPNWYDNKTRWTLSAYALYVRYLAGDSDPIKAQNLIQQAGLENLSLPAMGWLWQVVENPTQKEAIRRLIGNRIVETASAANFITEFNEQSYLLLDSERRTDAILLDALMSDNPQSELIPKLVNGLLAHRVKGRWNNTQENVFVLLALDRYFQTYESQTPDFVARLWLGDTYAGSSTFRGRTTEIHEFSIPMDFVLQQTASGMQSLLLSKEGNGRLYYRLGLHYAPASLQLEPLDMGFVVERRYEAVDDPADVVRDAAGRWHIRAGARLRVRLTLVADSRRYHVALIDPLPAGLEILNPSLAVIGDLPQGPETVQSSDFWGWWRTWYEHQNLRDNRAEAFTSLLWAGVYEYSYIARATTPGTFIVPPAKAEEMYSPEVFGRCGTEVVIVE
ncbi:MAG: MG2 domain-containing protein [Anaerolineales bacterium]